MTLRRKNLMSKPVVVTMYGIGLASAVALVVYEHTSQAPNGFNSFYCQGLLVNLATLLRLGPRIPILRIVQDNKYLLWFSLGMLLRYIRPMFDEPLSAEQMMILQGIRLAMFGLFFYKALGFSTKTTTAAKDNGTTTKKVD
jgi:hypothetical protein